MHSRSTQHDSDSPVLQLLGLEPGLQLWKVGLLLQLCGEHVSLGAEHECTVTEEQDSLGSEKDGDEAGEHEGTETDEQDRSEIGEHDCSEAGEHDGRTSSEHDCSEDGENEGRL